jgi:hypothetical protein
MKAVIYSGDGAHRSGMKTRLGPNSDNDNVSVREFGANQCSQCSFLTGTEISGPAGADEQIPSGDETAIGSGMVETVLARIEGLRMLEN